MGVGQGAYDDFNDEMLRMNYDIEKKISQIAQLSLSITTKTEYLMNLFNNRLVTAIIENNLSKDTIE
jgi:hypothetical protein